MWCALGVRSTPASAGARPAPSGACAISGAPRASPHTNVSRAPTYSETSAVSLGDAEGAPPARNAPTAGIPTTALAVRSPSGASGDPLAWTINSGGRIHPSRALLDSRTSSTGAKAVGCPLTEEEATGGPLKGAKMAGGCGGDCATDGQEGSSAAAVQPLERRCNPEFKMQRGGKSGV